MAPRTPKSADERAEALIEMAEKEGLETCFERASTLKPCPIGESGACCKHCEMGPCRLVGEHKRGVCGASVDTVAARNLVRMIASGAAAHSDHARNLALLLLEVAEGKAKDYQIRDVRKLYRVASDLGVEFEARAVEEVARDVALKLIEDFGRQEGRLHFLKRAPKKTQERWEKYGVAPRGIDREIVECLHRTSVGVDHDPDNLLRQGLRAALADGWGGCMIATDISDILFGTPRPLRAEGSFGIFLEDEVNIVVHGHEPELAEVIVDMASDPEMVEYARSKGAKGINLAGFCCTANEVLMRHGIPTAGGFTNQELGILTGLVEAMVVDVQCIMPGIVEVAKNFHTKVITTTEKAMIPGAVHIPFDAERAREVAREIIKLAIDNYPNRKAKGSHITERFPLIAGFSHEYIEYMQGGSFRASFRPLNDAIIAGRIRGVAAIVGCDNPKVMATGIHKYLATELIKQDVLIVTTGCGAHACGLAGYLTPELALEMAGPGLREVCEAIGIPPILHLGACVDNSRILTIVSAMAREGGLSDEIGGMPAVGIAPERMSEKAITIAAYVVASGTPVIMGGSSPVAASKEVQRIITEVWYERFRGALHFESDPERMLELTLYYIDKARDYLKLRKYEPGRFGVERKLMSMEDRRKLDKVARPHEGVG